MISRLLRISESIAKEFLEFLSRKVKTLRFKKFNPEILSSLRRDGFYIKQKALTVNECQSLIHEIDRLIENPNVNVWEDEQGADQRIYFAESISEKFKEVFENNENTRLLKEYTGIRKPVGFVLASRISYKSENQGSGGGWHRDSPYTHQFKSVYFLNNVTENNGPFQYIKGSHRKRIVLGAYFKKIFSPGQYRFNTSEIGTFERAAKKNAESFVCDAGTLLYADTKGIHRGKPLVSGKRYAIFCYYWDKKIPAHFDVLNQNSDNN